MLKVGTRIRYLTDKMEDFGINYASIQKNDIERMRVYDLHHFLISEGISVANGRRAELAMLAKAAVNLGLPVGFEDVLYWTLWFD